MGSYLVVEGPGKEAIKGKIDGNIEREKWERMVPDKERKVKEIQTKI